MNEIIPSGDVLQDGWTPLVTASHNEHLEIVCVHVLKSE